ncbi:MAG: phosphoadenosine phosphosulfate reductase [Roseburia sp.]|nr:phosphoadenosine phosphosulfate reductase [Roseburia sp.]
MKRQLKVCWISAGVSSFVAGYLERESIDEFIYIDIENQHPDSMRFIKECENALNKPIQILRSPYRNVENVIRQFRFINGPYGSKCTQILKKRVRKEWEDFHRDCELIYVWGFDLSEKNRAERLDEETPDIINQYPLIERDLSKQDAHAILNMLGIARPYMYDLGYSNNNCIGCVKGGMGYWNKIRIDFPEVFQRMSVLEREIGHSCINGVFLDELDPNRGRMENEIMQECSTMCYLNLE